MSNCNFQRLRVAVQLTSKDAADSTNDDNNNIEDAAVDSSYSPLLTSYQSLRLFDHQSLNIKIKPGKIVRQRFDHVNHAADDVLNAQVCLLLDELLLQRHNCSLLFFDGQRDGSNLIALFKMLIAEVNLRLEKLEASISKINLTYLKSDYKQQQSEEGDATHPEKQASGQRVCHFFNTMDFLKWLLNVYRLARSVATVYESLEINFRIRTSLDEDLNAEEVFDIKLSVFDLYCTKMDVASRKKLLAYVTATEQRQEDFQHTEMTSVLREYLEEEGDSSKLLLCNIPSKMRGNKINAFLLTVAIKMYERFAKDENNHISKRSLPNFMNPLNKSMYEESPLALPKPRAISFNIPFNERCSKKRLSQKSYCNEDLNKLRSWYTKLDEGFAEATTLMERYYDMKFDIKTDQMCKDIKVMSRSNDFVNSSLGTEENGEAEANESDEDLQDLYNEWKDSLQQMNSELEVSKFAENLKVYFYTKHFAHSQQILRLQINQLRRFKQRLNEVLDEELQALNSLVFVEET